jgi:hypothetical protein
MRQPGLRRFWERCTVVWALAGLLRSVPSQAQSGAPGVRHVRWPLLDVVMLPDSSAGLWLLVAPNLTTVQWDAGTPLVSLGVDPILALQWATAARRIIATPADNESQTTLRLTPPLKDTRGPEYLLLARNPRKSAPKDAFVFLVSDSASHTQ